VRVIVFGTGVFYKNRANSFSGAQIIGFVDNDKAKWNSEFSNSMVHNPEWIKSQEYDYLCVMVKRGVEEIYLQLEEMGINRDKILSYEAFLNLKKYNYVTHYYSYGVRTEEKNHGPRILLMIHELSLSGAPMVMYYLAQMLISKGYRVSFFSFRDGGLKEILISEGIDVFIQPDVTTKSSYFMNWLKEFDKIIVCTLLYGDFIKCVKDENLPIIWWLHESEEVYRSWWEKKNPGCLSNSIRVYNGGVRALNTYKKYFETDKGEVLLYGIPELNPLKIKKQDDKNKFVFAVVATLQPRKGQDIFTEAVLRLSEKEKEDVEFWIIGGDPGYYKEMVEKVNADVENDNHLKIYGGWSREKLNSEYRNIDVLVCPSRDDPLPVVVPEAMSFYIPCIVSTGCGTSYYIKDMENGIICEPTVESVCEKLKWTINNKEKLSKIGECGRELYENEFSLKALERNIGRIFSEMDNSKSDYIKEGKI